MDEAEQWKMMQNRIQQRGVNVFAYFHDKVQMCRRLKLSDTVTKKMVCTGLQSRDLSNRLLCKTYASEESMLRDIREFSEVKAKHVERFRSGPRNDNVKYRQLSNEERWPRRNAAILNANVQQLSNDEEWPKRYAAILNANNQHQTDYYLCDSFKNEY